MVHAYILIQTEVGKAAQVASTISEISGVTKAEDVTGPYDVIVRAEAGTPRTPIERQAFAAQIERQLAQDAGAPACRGGQEMTQLLLAMSWFRQHPEEYESTSPYRKWLN